MVKHSAKRRLKACILHVVLIIEENPDMQLYSLERPGNLALAETVRIPAGNAALTGDLQLPHKAKGVVLFAHGSGSGRLSPRNRLVAVRLQQEDLATLLVDLLTEQEEVIDAATGQYRFDIGLLAGRLTEISTWVEDNPELGRLPLGYFGASTGAAAALVAAAELPKKIRAVVSRSGRPDLAGPTLQRVLAPTLLIVGSLDKEVLRLNDEALRQLAAAQKELVVIPNASHLFEEPGKLEEVADFAADWFVTYLHP